MIIKKTDLLNGAALKEMSISDLKAVRNIFETEKEKAARIQKEKEMDLKRKAFEKDCENIKEKTHKDLKKLFKEIF